MGKPVFEATSFDNLDIQGGRVRMTYGDGESTVTISVPVDDMPGVIERQQEAIADIADLDLPETATVVKTWGASALPDERAVIVRFNNREVYAIGASDLDEFLGHLTHARAQLAEVAKSDN